MKSGGWLYGPCTHSHTELFLSKSEIAHTQNYSYQSLKYLTDIK